ncbi:MAG: class II glutamine amidotransferase, partial [Gammaproteobacteria bacterium]
GEPCYLNVAVSDGVNAVASRYANDVAHLPETLYYFCDHLYESCEADKLGSDAVVVSSERLTESQTWKPVPPNHLIVLSRGKAPVLIPCGELYQQRAA